jgi:hypothetical protein
MLVNKSSKKLHEDTKINSNNSTVKGENFKSDKEWLQEKVLKINGFIWNKKGNILVGKYFWPASSWFDHIFRSLYRNDFFP